MGSISYHGSSDSLQTQVFVLKSYEQTIGNAGGKRQMNRPSACACPSAPACATSALSLLVQARDVSVTRKQRVS